MSEAKSFKEKIHNVPPVLWMLITCIAIFTILSPQFFELSNFRNILIQAAPLLVVSIGVTVVLLSEGVDLSTGGTISLTTVLWITFLKMGIPITVAIIMTLIIALFVGGVNGFIVAKGNIPPFIVTLGMASITSGVALVITQGYSIYFFHPLFSRIVNSHLLYIPMPIVIAGVVFLVTWFLLYRTKYGAQVFGLGGNPEALTLGGINRIWSVVRVFSYSGLLAGITGLILASRIESGNPISGVGWEFDAVAATLIGGTSFNEGRGGIGGTILGVLLLAIIRNALNVIGVSSMYQSALIGSMVLLAIIIDVSMKNKKDNRIETEV